MMEKPVLVNFPVKLIERVDYLVRVGLYPNRNEAIRTAVRDLVNSDNKIVDEVIASKNRSGSS